MKALAKAFDAWRAGNLLGPYADDFKAGTYTASVFQGKSDRDNAPGFVISFVPLVQPKPQGGISCGAFRNFFVRTGIWSIVAEPKIC